MEPITNATEQPYDVATAVICEVTASVHSPAPRLFAFFCPGCGYDHSFHVGGEAQHRVGRWAWNGSYDKPTFHPSLLCNQDMPEARCHSWVKDGKIQFLQDSHHSLANKTVDLPLYTSS